MELRGCARRVVEARVSLRSGPCMARQVELAAVLQLFQDEIRRDFRCNADDSGSVSEVHERVLPSRLGGLVLRGDSPDALLGLFLRMDGGADHHEVADCRDG